MATLDDVAREAGVTKMTVSNVLNGRRARVSEATFDRVMEAVERLNYVPNALARSLSARGTGLVALVYQVSPGEHALDNPHDSIFLGEVEREVAASGRYLMLHSAKPITRVTHSLRSWNVDGAIFLGPFADQAETLRSAHDIPMVFIDNYNPSPELSIVGVDDHRGGYLAGRHLIGAGHTRLAFAGPSHRTDGVVQRRYRGFVAALDEAGLQLPAGHTYECDVSLEPVTDLSAVARRIAADPGGATAVFVTADALGVALLRALREEGVRVPEDVSIVGFDDLPLARAVSPQLTTIRQDIPAKANAAVAMLLGLLGAGSDPGDRRVTLDVELVERASVAAPRR